MAVKPMGRNPHMDHVPLSDLPDYWRRNNILPDQAWYERVNERIDSEFYDMYMKQSPDGWLSWNDIGDPDYPVDPSKIPDADKWDRTLAGFYETVRDIDVFSREGRDGPPAFARGLVRDDIKDMIPGYRDYEAGIEQAAAARRSAENKLPPVYRPGFRAEHGVGSFLAGLDLSKKGAEAVSVQREPDKAKTKEQQEEDAYQVAVNAAKRAMQHDISDLPDVIGETAEMEEDKYGTP